MTVQLSFNEARERLRGIIKETKLIYSSHFSQESGQEIYLKPENLQVTGSFKIRGAYNKIYKLTPEEKKRGLIASSAGNHAQGVAYAAKMLGVDATVVMPKTAPLVKIEATKSYGANVVLHGDFYDEAYNEAKRLQEENNYVFVHPFNDLDVIEGQGSIALEILEEKNDLDYILVPIGGGGLIAGIALAAKSINPRLRIIGVEPEGAQAAKISVHEKRIISLEYIHTIADGVAVKCPGELTFPVICDYVDEIITVTDQEIMEAFLLLLDKHKLLGESSGVLSLAAAKKLSEQNKKIACIVSGGNIDVLTLSAMIRQGLISRGRIFCFAVDLPDRPGQLAKISELLANVNANIVKLEHNQFRTMDRFMEVELEVTVETNGHKHIEAIYEEFQNAGYRIARIY